MIPISVLLTVAAGGAIGSVARALVQRRYGISTDRLPHGTLAVNVVGSFLLGLAIPLLPTGPDSNAALFAIVGLIGGFTTFSTFAAELAAMLRARRTTPAAVYAIVTLALGLAAAAAGLALGLRLGG